MKDRNLQYWVKGFGTGLAAVAYYGHNQHIHNGYAGFKGDLVSAGAGTPAGAQGAGVYGHILFNSGVELIARAGFAEGVAAYHANRFKNLGTSAFWQFTIPVGKGWEHGW